MIRGIGPVYAKRMVRKFGKDVFDVIEATPLANPDARRLLFRDNAARLLAL